MKGRAFFTLLFFVVVAGAAIFGASFVSAAGGPYRTAVVNVGEADAHAKDGAGYIGVYMDDLTARMADKAGYPHKTGILIAGVVQGGPAEKAGVQENDIVYLFNGVKVKDTEQFASLVKKQKAGDRVALVIYRDGAEKKISVVLGAREEPAVVTEDFGTSSPGDESKQMGLPVGPALELFKGATFARGRLGLELANLNEDLAPYFSAKAGEGVLILAVEDESPAAKAGIKGGDVLLSVNRTAVSDAGDVIDAISDLDPGDTAPLEVARRGIKKTYDVEIEKN
ncbi:MAG: PDZ domain-containing protein, partial [Candidatus Krumholzibacteriaceae bacterium]